MTGTTGALAPTSETTPLLLSVADKPITTQDDAAAATTPTTAASTTPSYVTMTTTPMAATPATAKETAAITPPAAAVVPELPYLQQKAQDIELLLSRPEIDLWKLRDFCLSPGGLVNDTIRKRAWPKLVGLDHNYDPLPLDNIVLDDKKKKKRPPESNPYATPSKSPSQPVVVTPTIEIDAQHELLQNLSNVSSHSPDQDNKGKPDDAVPPAATLLVESMDAAQIDRDVARCTWHLLTGSQRSRRSQHRSITQNSTRGKKHHGPPIPRPPPGNKTRLPAGKHSRGKYRRNRKVSVLLKKKQTRLANLINLTLVQSYDRSDGRFVPDQQALQPQPSPDRLRYYQGYHDVACIFLHALGGAASNHHTEEDPQSPQRRRRHKVYRHYASGDLDLPSKVLCQVSFSHFKDALRSDFLRLQTGLKLILFPLLSRVDREVHDHLLDADMEPFFCLSWILTWFSHDVRDTALVKRLFDAFLVGHPTLPVYAALAMMTHPYNRQRILATDCDFAALHQCLASLPRHSCRVGYKAQRVEGFDDLVVYVSDDDGETIANASYGGGYGGNDTATQTTDFSYLEDQPSEYDDTHSHATLDSHATPTSQYTSETIYTESSFPTSINAGVNAGVTVRRGSFCSGASVASDCESLGPSYNYAAGMATGCPADRTIISTELEPDFLSKESTLASGKWDESWGGGAAEASPSVPPAGGTTSAGESHPTAQASAVLEDPNPVPFEAVLESALQVMKNYPPGSLVDLAKKYYRDDWESQLSLLGGREELPLDLQELIGLLRPAPPAWSVLPTSTSDWVDKQRQRQDSGRTPTSRKDRRRRNRGKGTPTKTPVHRRVATPTKTPVQSNRRVVVATSDEDDNHSGRSTRSVTTRRSNRSADAAAGDDDPTKPPKSDPMDYVRSNPEDRVVAAIGYGPGMEAKLRERKRLRQLRRRKKRRRALAIGCGVVVLGAFALYGGRLLLVGNHPEGPLDEPSVLEPTEQPVPPAQRQLLRSGDKRTNASIDVASSTAGTMLPRLHRAISQHQSVSDHQHPPLPSTPERKTASPVAKPSMRTTSSVVASLSTPTLAAPTLPLASLALQRTRAPALARPPPPITILHKVVLRTRLVVTRFVHHVWTVCRRFVVGPLRFLLLRRPAAASSRLDH